MRRIYSYISTIIAAATLAGCSGASRLDQSGPGDGLVMITAPAAGEFCTKGPGVSTKAEPQSYDDLFINSTNSLPGVRTMTKGSTLWLLVEVPGPGYDLRLDCTDRSQIQEPSEWVISDEYSFRPYVVGENGAMYPCATREYTEDGHRYCAVDIDGEGHVQANGAALMLPPGLYRFHAVAPATALLTEKSGEKQEPTVHLANGEYVLATDPRWIESYPKGVYIPGGTEVSGVHNVSLPALVHQTARIKMTIRCGENVHNLGVQENGIKISGIQQDPYAEFKWTMADTIKTRVGNKYEGLAVREFEISQDSEGNDVITAYASILPTDARSSTIYILFHLIVNNVPTQYMVGLTNQLYRASHQYSFNFTVNVGNNLTVGTWDNTSLVYEEVEL